MQISTELKLNSLNDALPIAFDEVKHNPISRVETSETISNLLITANIFQGDVVFVHSALSSFGYIAGGADAVLQALLKCVGAEGTLVFPAFTGNNSDPIRWKAPPVNSQEVRCEILKATLPYDAQRSIPWSRVGSLPRAALLCAQSMRSAHPQLSFIAIGKQAEELCQPEVLEFDYPFSMKGVLGRLYSLKAKILFVGTTWNTCTALHLSEHILHTPIPNGLILPEISVAKSNGQKVYAYYNLMKLDTSDFNKIGSELETQFAELFSSRVQLPRFGSLLSMPFTQVVDRACEIMKQLRHKI
jgi:aminoglycoside 3-N-acetyltransferase